MLTDAPAPRATIPQRLDRLPLTWALWRLALVTQAGWGLVVATDAIAARIYPFVWGPRHAFGTAAFSILLLVSTGVGIVVGEYLFALLADRCATCWDPNTGAAPFSYSLAGCLVTAGSSTG